MVKNIIIGFIGIAIITVATFSYFKVNKNGSNNTAPLSAVNSANEKILSDIEHQIYSVAKGEINPNTYNLIDSQLKTLEGQDFEPDRTKAIRTALEKLNIGGSKKQTTETPAQVKVQAFPQITKSPSATMTPSQTVTKTETPKPNNTMPCISNPRPIFTRHVTDMSQVNYVVPPPTIGAGPSLKTHGYLGTDHVRVPVYAPVDMILNTGAYFEGGLYWLGFEVSCEVTLRFGHMTEPIQAVRDVFPATPAPANDSRDQQIKNKIYFKAGDLIGYTTGTSAAGNWDMGVYNSTTSNKYKGDPTWGNSWVYTTAICPFDYFEPNLKSAYTSKFSSTAMGGNIRDGESFCR